MTEPDFEPNSLVNNNAAEPFDFSALNAQPSEMPDAPPYVPPTGNTDEKRKWWQTKPKTEKTRKASLSVGAPARMSDAALKGALENFYSACSMAMMPFCMHCAMNVGDNATKCAEAMVEWSKTNAAIRRFLVNMVAISAGGKVIAVHSAMLMPIAMHHVPVLRERQEKMAGEMGEMFARMAAQQRQGDSEE